MAWGPFSYTPTHPPALISWKSPSGSHTGASEVQVLLCLAELVFQKEGTRKMSSLYTGHAPNFPAGLLSQNPGLGGWTSICVSVLEAGSQLKVRAGLFPSEPSLLGLQMVIVSLCVHRSSLCARISSYTSQVGLRPTHPNHFFTHLLFKDPVSRYNRILRYCRLSVPKYGLWVHNSASNTPSPVTLCVTYTLLLCWPLWALVFSTPSPIRSLGQ